MSAETTYTAQDVSERIHDVMSDPTDHDLKDAELIATLATFIASDVLHDITKAMWCLDLVRSHDRTQTAGGGRHE